MSINYLEGIRPGDKIDVSAWSKPDKSKKLGGEAKLESYLPELRDFLRKQAAEVNQEFAGFLNEEGRITVVGYDAKSREDLVRVQEEVYSKESGKSLGDWKRDKEKNPATLTEMALTIMLHKFLKEHFIVARSSSYDDYNNGVDQVLVYKETGEVVCGIDEVIINPSDKDGATKKAVKLSKIMAKGGANILDAAKLENNHLVRSAVKNIPAFYMPLGRADLSELLDSLKNNPKEITAVEEKIFSRLLVSLEEQARSNVGLNKELKEKTESALEKLRLGLNAKKLAA